MHVCTKTIEKKKTRRFAVRLSRRESVGKCYRTSLTLAKQCLSEVAQSVRVRPCLHSQLVSPFSIEVWSSVFGRPPSPLSVSSRTLSRLPSYVPYSTKISAFCEYQRAGENSTIPPLPRSMDCSSLPRYPFFTQTNTCSRKVT